MCQDPHQVFYPMSLMTPTDGRYHHVYCTDKRRTDLTKYTASERAKWLNGYLDVGGAEGANRVITYS